MKIPVVSMGVVRWVEHMLTDSTFFEEAAESSPLFLVLLDEAPSCHTLQHLDTGAAEEVGGGLLSHLGSQRAGIMHIATTSPWRCFVLGDQQPRLHWSSNPDSIHFPNSNPLMDVD